MNDYKTIFESKRINFCRINDRLVNDYLTMVNDSEVARFISHNIRTFTYEDEYEWVKSKIRDNATIFSMVEKETKAFIGNIEFRNIENGSGEIGICITKKMQNNHYGTEAMQAFIDYGYNVIGLNNIYLYVYNFNKRAIKCYKNCGFEIVGPGTEEDDFKMVHRRRG